MKELDGLSKQTASLLIAFGFDTRQKILEAGEIALLKLPLFGIGRLDEVCGWLGIHPPSVRQKISSARTYLESLGYQVTPPKVGAKSEWNIKNPVNEAKRRKTQR